MTWMSAVPDGSGEQIRKRTENIPKRRASQRGVAAWMVSRRLTRETEIKTEGDMKKLIYWLAEQSEDPIATT